MVMVKNFLLKEIRVYKRCTKRSYKTFGCTVEDIVKNNYFITKGTY